jgi:hypothetical protein
MLDQRGGAGRPGRHDLVQQLLQLARIDLLRARRDRAPIPTEAGCRPCIGRRKQQRPDHHAHNHRDRQSSPGWPGHRRPPRKRTGSARPVGPVSCTNHTIQSTVTVPSPHDLPSWPRPEVPTGRGGPPAAPQIGSIGPARASPAPDGQLAAGRPPQPTPSTSEWHTAMGKSRRTSTMVSRTVVLAVQCDVEAPGWKRWPGVKSALPTIRTAEETDRSSTGRWWFEGKKH